MGVCESLVVQIGGKLSVPEDKKFSGDYRHRRMVTAVLVDVR